jgi:hypothetical protein
MSTDLEAIPVCPECGGALAAKDGVCPKCQTSEPQNDWEKERDRLKKLWILVTLFFWFSLIFQAGLFILDGTLNLIILSIILGTMVLGTVLKFRLNLHLRKAPGD